MQAPDRQSKLAEIKLVSKYYPVANYSYPRKDDGTTPMSPTSPNMQRHERTSIGSDGSAPGLVDDRTDSEVSQEDDYQYHTHATELWDSFWQPGGEWRLEDPQVDLVLPVKEDYPALIPSPQHRRQPSQKSVRDEESPAWPLPSPTTNPGRPASRKPTKYSAFPTLKPMPNRSSLVPGPLSPRAPSTATMGAARVPPPRPERPAALLTPCLEQPAKVPAAFATDSSIYLPRGDSRPKTSSGAPSRSSKFMGGHGKTDSNPLSIYSIASRSSEDLTKAPPTRESHRTPRHCKSTTYLGAARQQQRQQQQQQQLRGLAQQQEAEPHSVFEDDSDSEESGGISFFRFHKRSGSDKSYKAASAAQEAALHRRRRNRADTIPVPSPTTTKPASSERERKVDVFGRMLGRRSR